MALLYNKEKHEWVVLPQHSCSIDAGKTGKRSLRFFPARCLHPEFTPIPHNLSALDQSVLKRWLPKGAIRKLFQNFHVVRRKIVFQPNSMVLHLSDNVSSRIRSFEIKIYVLDSAIFFHKFSPFFAGHCLFRFAYILYHKTTKKAKID